MDLFEVLRARHSIRAFEDRPVEPDKLEAILESANLAPSAGNLQAYEISVVTHRPTIGALAQATQGQTFITQAPVVLVFSANASRSVARYGPRGASLYCIQDATIACAYAQLAATALGLGSVWVGAFDESSVWKAIQANGKWLPVAVLPIGYAAEKPEPAPRRTLKGLVQNIS